MPTPRRRISCWHSSTPSRTGWPAVALARGSRATKRLQYGVQPKHKTRSSSMTLSENRKGNREETTEEHHW